MSLHTRLVNGGRRIPRPREISIDNLSPFVHQHSNPNYRTTPQLTGGTWVDGRPIYRAAVDMGSMPAADNKGALFDDGTNGAVDFVIRTWAMAREDSGAVIKYRPLGQIEDALTGPVSNDTGVQVSINTTTGAGSIVIESEGNWGSWTVWGFVEYVREAS